MSTEDTYEQYKSYYRRSYSRDKLYLIPPGITEEIRSRTHGDILDIGTGTGEKLQYLLEPMDPNSIRHVTALDPSPLRKRAHNNFEEMDLEQFKILKGTVEDFDPDRSFDTILYLKCWNTYRSRNRP